VFTAIKKTVKNNLPATGSRKPAAACVVNPPGNFLLFQLFCIL
jgi:hypothetical protein